MPLTTYLCYFMVQEHGRPRLAPTNLNTTHLVLKLTHCHNALLSKDFLSKFSIFSMFSVRAIILFQYFPNCPVLFLPYFGNLKTLIFCHLLNFQNMEIRSSFSGFSGLFLGKKMWQIWGGKKTLRY